MSRLDGKVVSVTGAGQGIGRAYARGILQAGGNVVYNDIDAALLDAELADLASQGLADRASGVVADISDWNASESLIAHAQERFGRLDGLVNNAGLYDVRRAEENDEAVVRSLVEVNIYGTMFCGLHAMRAMLDADGGSIINATSGALVGLPLRGIYSATKAAVAALTWSWALDMKDTNVRVNAISPLARTRQLDVAASYLKVPHEQLLAKIPAEVNAPVMTYLLSDDAQDIRGQIVRISERMLTLITRPDIVRPVIELTESSVEAVETAFNDHLRAALQPLAAPNWSPVGSQGKLEPGVASRS